jgi:aldehyde dehydrogenase (NAD+)
MAAGRPGKSVKEETVFPTQILNWIDGRQSASLSGQLFDKRNPASGEKICSVVRSDARDIDAAVLVAKKAHKEWATIPPVQRGMVLHTIVKAMQDRLEDIAAVVALETGKSFNDACGETRGAIELGLFYASEGQRLYGRTTTSSVADKLAMTIRQPIGVAGLIIAANTPVANVAWKVFPALICGNAVVLKSSEDTPVTSWLFGEIAHQSGLMKGVLNIVQGTGEEAGRPLVAHPDVNVISFTGSTAVGREIAGVAGTRMARVSLELGGKNPLVVCDDADLDNAVKWTILSGFSNAGQRCASASRIIVFDAVYDLFREKLLERASSLLIGPGNDDDLGPVINEKQLENMLSYVSGAAEDGAVILLGGHRLTDKKHAGGFYMAPTVIENVKPDAPISLTELFGPIICLYKVKNFEEAISLANNSPYGLTASIHTNSFHRATLFTQNVEAGVAVVNAGTFGSEPHMPFGGVKQSGNGWREPGTEAIDIYSSLKDIYLNFDRNKL